MIGVKTFDKNLVITSNSITALQTLDNLEKLESRVTFEPLIKLNCTSSQEFSASAASASDSSAARIALFFQPRCVQYMISRTQLTASAYDVSVFEEWYLRRHQSSRRRVPT